MDQFRRIVHALRSSHRAAGNLELTGAQLFVLNVVGDADRPLSISEVAEKTETDQSTVSVVASRMVERGLLSRKQNATDTRRVELSLTARGRALKKRAPATIGQQRLAASLESLPPRQARNLLRLLDRIVTDMQIAEEPAEMLFNDERPPVRRTRTTAKRRPPARPSRRT